MKTLIYDGISLAHNANFSQLAESTSGGGAKPRNELELFLSFGAQVMNPTNYLKHRLQSNEMC